MDISNIHHTVSQLIYDYSENMSYYNRNMRELIHVYERTVDNMLLERTNNSRRSAFSRYNNSSSNRSTATGYRSNNNNINTRYFSDISFNPVIGPRNTRYHIFDNLYFNSNYEDVIIRPTPEQILVSTEIINWSDNLLQTQCPISLDPFDDNERICRIRNCNHLFKISPLMNWFERNVRCPVCRYDIRDYQNTLSNNTISEPEPNSDYYIDNSNNNNLTNETTTLPENNNSEYSDLPDLIDTDELTTNPYINPEYYNRSNNRNSTIQENISTIFREFLTGELNRSVPLVNESVNDIFYAFNIPLEIDVSYTQIF